MRTGIIGLGAMGLPMARNLARAGYLTAVYSRSSEKSAQITFATGAHVAPTPAALAECCDLILISVTADTDVVEIVDALLPGLRSDSIVVDTSTVGVDTARHAAQCIATAQAAFLDAPVSGGVEGAVHGQLAMMVGGDPKALERARPVLSVLAQRITHMGPAGAGQATKAVNQVMVAGINQAVTEALALAAALDLSMQEVLDVIASGAAGNWFLDHRGASMLTGHYGTGFKVSLHHKDLALCQKLAHALGAQLPIVEMTLIHYRRLMEAGYGDEDISALFRLKQRLFTGSPGKLE